VTKNYRLFKNSAKNRDLDLPKHRNLRLSMQEYGFLPELPVIVSRDETGQLTIEDGQHRVAFAELLGLPVYWVEKTANFEIAKLNGCSRGWTIIDFAENFAKNGNQHYGELLEFSERRGIKLTISACMLSGALAFSKISVQFRVGQFEVKERELGDVVAQLYSAFRNADPRMATTRLVEALVAVARTDLDAQRMISNISYCHDKLHQYSSRDGFLDMLEEIYNFRKKSLVPLKINAVQAMRSRSSTQQGS
jgi:hypothetical protein